MYFFKTFFVIHGEPEKIPEAAKQYKALDTGMMVRFCDLYQLRRRNVDWTKVFDDNDLEREGLIKKESIA